MALRLFNIAKDKDGDLERVLQYDITAYSPLFNGSLMEKPKKADILAEVKSLACLVPEKYKYCPGENDCVVVDFMSFIRSQSLEKLEVELLDLG